MTSNKALLLALYLYSKTCLAWESLQNVLKSLGLRMRTKLWRLSQNSFLVNIPNLLVKLEVWGLETKMVL